MAEGDILVFNDGYVNEHGTPGFEDGSCLQDTGSALSLDDIVELNRYLSSSNKNQTSLQPDHLNACSYTECEDLQHTSTCTNLLGESAYQDWFKKPDFYKRACGTQCPNNGNIGQWEPISSTSMQNESIAPPPCLSPVLETPWLDYTDVEQQRTSDRTFIDTSVDVKVPESTELQCAGKHRLDRTEIGKYHKATCHSCKSTARYTKYQYIGNAKSGHKPEKWNPHRLTESDGWVECVNQDCDLNFTTPSPTSSSGTFWKLPKRKSKKIGPSKRASKIVESAYRRRNNRASASTSTFISISTKAHADSSTGCTRAHRFKNSRIGLNNRRQCRSCKAAVYYTELPNPGRFPCRGTSTSTISMTSNRHVGMTAQTRTASAGRDLDRGTGESWKPHILNEGEDGTVTCTNHRCSLSFFRTDVEWLTAQQRQRRRNRQKEEEAKAYRDFVRARSDV
ncbi:uncharacterized protein I303_100874 [Kwoniella dejecticola CBS 10117]|uniref:Uncharacterized protein n=1 Tax=Kwoniella dejecticola CBS 10117 TaxID=1296121 RepID=A0A1A6AG55_9TREE|nr:uncharacterized protein I303_00877 [Kwoniella dejecticola CBS 10117]OBR89055.1 hypothetical protein I303_00877 [Kwoniella dejecticola CBS 10117]